MLCIFFLPHWNTERHFYNERPRKRIWGGIINHKWWFSKIILKEQCWWEIFIWDIIIIVIIIAVYFIISSDYCEYFYHLSWCEVLQRKGTWLLFVNNWGQELFWRCSQCCESSHGKSRWSITLLCIPRYTLWLKHCCVFWTWVTYHSCHCVQIEVRQEISITKHGKGSYSLDAVKLKSSMKWIDSSNDSQNAWINLKNWIIAVYSFLSWSEKNEDLKG